MNNIYFLWNEDYYAVMLKKEIGSEKIITSEKELSILLHDNLNVDGIIILAELKWNNNNCTDFYGFEVVNSLRANYRLRIPIGICSYVPLTQLRKEFKILDYPHNHPFIRLPFIIKQSITLLNNSEVMDQYRLNDIVNNACNVKGRIKKLITHGKGFGIIFKEYNDNISNKTIWNDCNEDLIYLKKYLCSFSKNNSLETLYTSLINTLDDAMLRCDITNVRRSLIDLFDNLK